MGCMLGMVGQGWEGRISSSGKEMRIGQRGKFFHLPDFPEGVHWHCCIGKYGFPEPQRYPPSNISASTHSRAKCE